MRILPPIPTTNLPFEINIDATYKIQNRYDVEEVKWSRTITDGANTQTRYYINGIEYWVLLEAWLFQLKKMNIIKATRNVLALFFLMLFLLSFVRYFQGLYFPKDLLWLQLYLFLIHFLKSDKLWWVELCVYAYLMWYMTCGNFSSTPIGFTSFLFPLAHTFGMSKIGLGTVEFFIVFSLLYLHMFFNKVVTRGLVLRK